MAHVRAIVLSMGPRLVALAALAAALACPASPTERTTTLHITAALPAAAADTPAAHQLAWFVHLLNHRGGALTTAEAETHFAPDFLAKFPPATVVAQSAAIAAENAPVAIHQVRQITDDHLDARGDSSAGPLRILLRTTRDGAIDGLLVEPYADLDREELLRTIPTLAPRATLLSAELVDDGCRPLHAVDADANLSLASISKLYILLAVVDAILAGEHSWDEPVTIRDALRGEPSRILGTHPDGATLPLRDVLHALIGASDNAANDHLIDLVGRRAVEAAVRASGHHDPALNQPYLTFREFRRLWRLHPSVTDRYLALDEQARRDFLARVLDDLTAPIDERRNLDTIGIFASATDVCRLIATLVQRARRPEAAPLLEILADGAKLGPSDLTGDDWTFVGGKSGELGVLGFNDVSSRAVLLRRADDRWFVVVLGLESAGQWTSFARRPIHAVVARIFDLLAREGRP